MEDAIYDPMKDFTYIINMVDNVFAVTVQADAPFKTWADLLAWGRANQQKVSYAAPPGLGQSAHLFMEEVAAREKVAWQAVPYKGSAESVTALLGGHVSFSVDTVIGTSASVRAGKARYLAVASEHRMKSFPDVPTMRDLGYAIIIDSPTGLWTSDHVTCPPRITANLWLSPTSINASCSRATDLPRSAEPRWLSTSTARGAFMLDREKSRLITQCTGDAPMGQLMREYWIPVIRTSQLIASQVPFTSGAGSARHGLDLAGQGHAATVSRTGIHHTAG